MRLFYSLISLGARVVPLLIVITIVTRNESASYIGQFLYALSILGVLSTSLEYGHTNSVVVWFRSNEFNIGKLALLAKAANVAPYLFAVSLATVLADASLSMMMKLAGYFALFHVENVTLILIRLRRGFKAEAHYSSGVNILFFVAFLLFEPFLDPALAMLFARSLSLIPISFLVTRTIFEKYDTTGSSNFFDFYKVSFSFFGTQLIGALVLNIDILALKYYLLEDQFRIYAIANRYYIPLSMISVAITPALLAILSNPKPVNKEFLKFMQIGLLLFAFTAGIWFFFDDVLRWLVPTIGPHLADLHPAYSIIVILRVVAVVLNVPLMVSQNRWTKMAPLIFALLVYLVFILLVRPQTLYSAFLGTGTMYLAMLTASVVLKIRQR